MKKIGLYFGTFNPIHIGHLILANHFAETTDLDEVWFVITPLSPFKKKKSLLGNHHRLAIANIAVEDFPKLKTSDIEFKLQQPNYTVNTLIHMEEKYPDHQFCLIMGEDNLNSLHKWKNYEMILEHYDIFIYQRPGNVSEMYADHEGVHYLDAPLLDISSSFIRKLCKEGKSIRYLVVDNVYRYITDSSMYK